MLLAESSRFHSQDLWTTIKERVSSSVSSSIHSLVGSVNSVIENRGGFAYLVGLLLVPSQFLSPKAAEANQFITKAAKNQDCKIQRFSLPVKGGDTSVKGIIYYPKNWDPTDRSRCVVYHNPNGVTVSEYFGVGGHLEWNPAELLKLAKCPIILYDYRGTGLSSENKCLSFFGFRPTYATIAEDGETVLARAMENFQSVSMVGSSLGGGVATVALERHLKSHPLDSKKVRLINHDSFSTTPKVIIPNWPRIANFLGWALGGLLDAETPMRSLVGRGIPITLLCHNKDPVIPSGARMAEFVETLPNKQNVSVIYSPNYGHADLSHDMVRKLNRI